MGAGKDDSLNAYRRIISTLSPAPYWVSTLLAPEPYHIRLVLPWPFNVTSSASRCGELNKQRHHPQKRNIHHGYNSSLHAINEPTQDLTKAILSPRKPKVKPGPCKQPLSSISEPYKFAKPAVTPSRQRNSFTKFKIEVLAWWNQSQIQDGLGSERHPNRLRLDGTQANELELES